MLPIGDLHCLSWGKANNSPANQHFLPRTQTAYWGSTLPAKDPHCFVREQYFLWRSTLSADNPCCLSGDQHTLLRTETTCQGSTLPPEITAACLGSCILQRTYIAIISITSCYEPQHLWRDHQLPVPSLHKSPYKLSTICKIYLPCHSLEIVRSEQQLAAEPLVEVHHQVHTHLPSSSLMVHQACRGTVDTNKIISLDKVQGQKKVENWVLKEELLL